MNITRKIIDGKFLVDEVEEVIDGTSYYLLPGQHFKLQRFFEKTQGYQDLDRQSQSFFERSYLIDKNSLNSQHQNLLREVLPSEICEYLIKEYKENGTSFLNNEFIERTLPIILNQEIDSQLCSYFNSEYTLLWYSFLDTEATSEPQKRSYSSYWHCDGGPKKHLKILIYLNSSDEHAGNTLFLDRAATNRLKDIGYIFNDIENRTDNIESLCKAKGINFEMLSYDTICAGDALIFNPNILAHKGQLPTKANRYVLQLCFIQSPMHWQEVITKIMPPVNRCIDFSKEVTETLISSTKIYSTEPSIQPIYIAADNSITSKEHLRFVINNICKQDKIANNIYRQILRLDPQLEEINSIDNLLGLFKIVLKDKINWQGEADIDAVTALEQLSLYSEEVAHSLSRYQGINKPKLNGIFWPLPDHPSHPASKFGKFPFVIKHGIMHEKTAIGSAGSCFAFEITRVLQEKGFNYIVTERNDNPTSGIGVDGYKPGDKYAKFCANYGILFNTPSFKQLAERAFGIKTTPALLFQLPDGGWVDPYRENILFFDYQAYQKDYYKHLNAVRAALEQCEVFIITLGLNECWEFRDGSVMARNPRPNMFPYVNHKTLTVDENVQNIQDFFDIVKQFNPEFKLVISVSPIPMLATGRGEVKHVIEANTHSKSVLRVAADILVENNPDMYYLPSYELVTECIEEPWEIDTRHVKRETVVKVVEMFETMFIKN
ncbi:MAG: hypothetical protein CMK65_00190 [Pseudoalteromonas sp.]|uniref:GSCFA domain-containing protein n=1 Tax=Pseudoalteromonas sp. TaxID=53249 RepID=UPI000C981B5D|nr:GSCFA domain-containing protein [Pseudoalteromonas sp.]MAD02031.1 hypothetical protein [Pseudoalteromonas sp.]|tara:strand:+ start:3562 stop:5715 length:2154 start_codon:yes stop_codon:yes gene_type:complete